MYPKTTYANIIVTIEAMIGLVGIAVTTGLAFARFSRPTARVVFSRVAVITPHDAMPTLMFRSANKRRNMILEAQMRVYLMRDEVTLEGQFMRRFHDLKLLTNQTPSFTLSWSVMHVIDEFSPLYGMTPESLIQTNTILIISLSGLDETVAQVVHARHTYGANDILWNNQFVDIFYHTPNGDRYIDYNRFHDVFPLDEKSWNTRKLLGNLIDWWFQGFNHNPTIFNYSATFNHPLAVVNWHILAMVLEAETLILLLLLVENDNITGGGGGGHITYFDLYIYYRSTDAIWLKNLLTMYFDNSGGKVGDTSFPVSD